MNLTDGLLTDTSPSPPPFQVSELILFVIKTEPAPIELFVLLLHIYALAVATLHQCRRGDGYQNQVAGLCLSVFWAGPAVRRLLRRELSDPGHWLSLLLVTLALGLLVSAVAHAGMNCWRNEKGVVPSEPGPTPMSAGFTEEAPKTKGYEG